VLDAKRLAAYALDLSDLELLTRENEPVPADAEAKLAGFMARRLTGESVARIIGEREFYGLGFLLNAATLEPRPETELLVDLAIKLLPEGGRLLDLGTGTGCIPISVLANRPDAVGVAVDISAEALEAASANALRHNVSDRLALFEGSWFEPLTQNPHPNQPFERSSHGLLTFNRSTGAIEDGSKPLKGEGTASSLGQDDATSTDPKPLPFEGRGWGGGSEAPGKFDLVVSNPPYIESALIPTLSPEVRDFDPSLALDGGPDGLVPYRIIIDEAPRHLAPDGRILLEIGYDQGAAVAVMLARAGFNEIVIHKDLNGLDRVASAHHMGGVSRSFPRSEHFMLGSPGRTI